MAISLLILLLRSWKFYLQNVINTINNLDKFAEMYAE